jgi:hypothetical protein
MKEENYTSTPPMGSKVCTEPQCLYKDVLYLFFCTNSELSNGNIPINYRHQYYRHELTLKKDGVKNVKLITSPYCRYQTSFCQKRNVIARNYEFRARETQLNLGQLVVCGDMLLLSILPTFRRLTNLRNDNPMILVTYLQQTSTQRRRNYCSFMLQVTAKAIGQ